MRDLIPCDSNARRLVSAWRWVQDGSDVLRWVMSQGGRPVVIGAGLGVVAALGLALLWRARRSAMSKHGRPADPLRRSVATIIVALAACYLPARAAMACRSDACFAERVAREDATQHGRGSIQA